MRRKEEQVIMNPVQECDNYLDEGPQIGTASTVEQELRDYAV